MAYVPLDWHPRSPSVVEAFLLVAIAAAALTKSASRLDARPDLGWSGSGPRRCLSGASGVTGLPLASVPPLPAGTSMTYTQAWPVNALGLAS